MHALKLRWTTGALLLFVACTFGCRGSRPFGQVVNVNQEPDSSTEIDAPRQRLATAKPRKGSGVQQGTGTANASAQNIADSIQDNSPHLAQNAAVRYSRNAESRSETKQPTNGPLNQGSSSKLVNSPQPSAPTTTTTNAQQVAAAAARSQANDTPTKSPATKNDVAQRDSIESASALATPTDRSPEALQRTIATMADSAEESGQPGSLGDQLNVTLSDLPQLPEASTGKRSESNPKGLLTGRSIISARSTVTDLATTEFVADSFRKDNADNTVEQAVVDSLVAEASEVQTASASRDVTEESPAKLALSDPSIAQSESESDRSINVTIQDEMQGNSGGLEQLSDAALFNALVARLSSPDPDETEGERASRLIKQRHLMVLAGDPDGAVEKIEGMAEAEQEFLRHQLLGLSTIIDPQGHPVPSRRLSAAIQQFRSATQFAAAATDTLEIRNLDFCTQIESYGQVTPFRNHRFDAGQQVIMYCEIENFTARDTEEGFETHLQGSYDIYDDQDNKILSQLLPADQQLSANYLRDYFIAYQMHLPKQLAAGKYRLQLTMEDMNAKKYGQSSIQFEIKK